MTTGTYLGHKKSPRDRKVFLGWALFLIAPHQLKQESGCLAKAVEEVIRADTAVLTH